MDLACLLFQCNLQREEGGEGGRKREKEDKVGAGSGGGSGGGETHECICIGAVAQHGIRLMTSGFRSGHREHNPFFLHTAPR